MKIYKTGVDKFLIDITDLELSALCEFLYHALKEMKNRQKVVQISPAGYRQFLALEKLCNQLKSVL